MHSLSLSLSLTLSLCHAVSLCLLLSPSLTTQMRSLEKQLPGILSKNFQWFLRTNLSNNIEIIGVHRVTEGIKGKRHNIGKLNGRERERGGEEKRYERTKAEPRTLLRITKHIYIQLCL